MTSPDFDNSYSRLPKQFYSAQTPTTVSAPHGIRVNDTLAASLGIDLEWLRSEDAIQTFAGNQIPRDAEPIATVYAGHQFGGWNPQLGDGRAILLGEVRGTDGNRYDIQLKGSGRTPYSRGGDGLAPLGPVLREYIVSEAMAALGIPTTRSLAAVATGDMVFREQALPGAVLTRVASSHIRIGTFQYFAARADLESVELLFRHAASRHFRETLDADNPPLAFLEAVIDRQASLIAKWQLIGFIHGVMNTDNMLVCGETIDYGPCAFMDAYDPKTVFSSIDHQGRYAYANQPRIAHWNLSWLAQSLIPLLDDQHDKAVELAQAAVDRFPGKYHRAYNSGLAAKLGFSTPSEENKTLGEELFDLMEEESVDFTLCFRKLADLLAEETDREISPELFEFPASFEPWLDRWKTMLMKVEQEASASQTRMRGVSPVFIPRNHRVEEVIQAAQNDNDYGPFHRLVDLLAKPHEYSQEMAAYALPPKPEQMVHRTFCGT